MVLLWSPPPLFSLLLSLPLSFGVVGDSTQGQPCISKAKTLSHQIGGFYACLWTSNTDVQMQPNMWAFLAAGTMGHLWLLPCFKIFALTQSRVPATCLVLECKTDYRITCKFVERIGAWDSDLNSNLKWHPQLSDL